MILESHILVGGSCRQCQGTIDGRSLRWVNFPARFLLLRHPTLGWIVCDTGYGGRFHAATRQWPYRLYRWATPVRESAPLRTLFAPLGIDPREIRHVILTHFHADHVGGLADFPQARFHHHSEALQRLFALTPLRQTRAAFLPRLIPEDFIERSAPVSPEAFKPTSRLPFSEYDLFGDGELRLVNLPGHAPGHVGLAYQDREGPVLYCADAFWRREQIEAAVDLPLLTLSLQWDRQEYKRTITALRQLARENTLRLFSCHEPG